MLWLLKQRSLKRFLCKPLFSVMWWNQQNLIGSWFAIFFLTLSLSLSFIYVLFYLFYISFIIHMSILQSIWRYASACLTRILGSVHKSTRSGVNYEDDWLFADCFVNRIFGLNLHYRGTCGHCKTKLVHSSDYGYFFMGKCEQYHTNGGRVSLDLSVEKDVCFLFCEKNSFSIST